MGLGAKIGVAVGAVAVAGAVTAGAIIATSSDDSGTAADRGAQSSESTSAGQSRAGSANPLWGTWTAPCDRILAVLMGEPELPSEMTCSGNYTMTLEQDGTFHHTGSGTITVTAPDGDFTQTRPWFGNEHATWSTDGTTMRIGGSQSSPVSVTPDVASDDDLPIVSLTNTGGFPFELDGDTLRLFRTFPAIGQVILVYNRA